MTPDGTPVGLTKDETFSISISICNWVVVPGVRLELCTDSAEFAKGIQMVSTKEIDSREEEWVYGREIPSNTTHVLKSHGKTLYSTSFVIVR